MIQQIRTSINDAWGRFQTFIKERPDKDTRSFIAHNRRVWGNYRPDSSQGEILIELNNMGGCVVAQSYLASYLGKKENAQLIAYTKVLSRFSKAVYGSFVDSFLQYSAEPYSKEVDELFLKYYPQIETKRDLEELHVNDIWIGDLVYDCYIRRLDAVTVDLQGDELPKFLRDAIGYLVFWQHYFQEHPVKAVLVSHCVYPWNGIIARVAIDHGVPVYLAQPNKMYFVTKGHNCRAYNDYIDYPENFARFSAQQQRLGLQQAQQRIAKRFRGERDVGGHHLIKPTYTEKTGERVLRPGNKPKILVASHCFSDDNHVYGNNLFPDFYEWLNFLGRISEQTDYDWYLKLHPDRYHWETAHLEEFVQRFPKFSLLAAETSHHQIIEDGIQCVLTVYGTIGFEYAALGIPVITAAQWNPTSAYDFNIHPKSVDEYKEILLKVSELEIQIDMDKVYEYYYCHYIDEPDDWLYESFTRLDAEIGGGRAHIGSLSYKKFLEQFSPQRHEQILATIHAFVESGDYCQRPCHVARADAVNSKE